jgi:hypothetical protein
MKTPTCQTAASSKDGFANFALRNPLHIDRAVCHVPLLRLVAAAGSALQRQLILS